MTKSELKRNVEETGSLYFTRKTMKFFGDTMANFGVRSYNSELWELYRKKPVNGNLRTSAYFDKVTFERKFIK